MPSVVPPEASWLAIPPASRAFMAWQLAAHWGNRRFARPRPRAEVVVAALIAGAGWLEEVEQASGGPSDLARSRLDPGRWRANVARARRVSRYAALLLAERFTARTGAAAGDLGSMDARALRAELAADPRYQGALGGPGLAGNLALLAAWEDVVDGLCAAAPGPFAVQAPERGGSATELELSPATDRTWRVCPWPLAGPQLDLQGEGWRVGPQGKAVGATVERVTFTLLRRGARS